MSRIDELIQQLCPDGVEYKMLGEIGTFVRGNGLQKKDFVDHGVGCIHYGQIYTYYKTFATETKSFVTRELSLRLTQVYPNDLILACTSENIEDVCKTVAWLGQETIVTGGHACVFRHKQNAKYLAYFFATDYFFAQKKKFARGAKVIDIKTEDLAKIVVPVPPLPVQEEIVRILDKFTALEAELKAELKARRKQYEFYRDQLLTFGDEVEWKPLGEVCDYVDYRGRTPPKTEKGIFLVTAKNIRRGFIDYSTSKEYISEEDYATVMHRGKPEIGDVLITTEAPCGFVAQVDRTNIALAQRVIKYRSRTPKLSNCFLKFFLLGKCFQEKLDKAATGSTVKGIKGSKLHKLTIPVPPLAEQERIVAILDKFDALVNDISSGLPAELEMRRKQYEYYRDRLLTFKPLAKEA